MEETAGFSLVLPPVNDWPIRYLSSTSNTRYFQRSEELSLPEYSSRFWTNFNEKTMAIATILWNKGAHPLPSPAVPPMEKQEMQSAWNFIKVEERKIRKGELILTDLVTGGTVEAKDTTYQANWANFDAYEKGMAQEWRSERMYFLLPEKLWGLLDKLKEMTRPCQNCQLSVIHDVVTAESGDGEAQRFAVFCIEISAPADKARREAWINATKSLAGLFLEINNATPMQVPEPYRRRTTSKHLSNDA